jgi:hypothetical protein
LKGHDFSRAVNVLESARASAPEGCFSEIRMETGVFPKHSNTQERVN